MVERRTLRLSALPSLPEGGNGGLFQWARQHARCAVGRARPHRLEAAGVRGDSRVILTAERVADRRVRPSPSPPRGRRRRSLPPGRGGCSSCLPGRPGGWIAMFASRSRGNDGPRHLRAGARRWPSVAQRPDLAGTRAPRGERPRWPAFGRIPRRRGRMQALPDAGDAIVGPLFRLTRRAVSSSVVEGDVVVLGSERLSSTWTARTSDAGSRHRYPAAAGEWSAAAREQCPGHLVDACRSPQAHRRGMAPWPTEVAVWSLPGGHAAVASPHHTGSTANVHRGPGAPGRRGVFSGGGGRPWPGGRDSLALRAAVLAMNARTGDILACAHLDRPSADPAPARKTPVSWMVCTRLHFVMAATAALGSSDPVVGAMVNGELPEGLVAGGRATLRGARLPGSMRSDSGPGRRLSSR